MPNLVIKRPQPHKIQHFHFHAVYFPKSQSEISKHNVFSNEPTSSRGSSFQIYATGRKTITSQLDGFFFATSHGKGVVDGMVKRAVWRHIQSHVTTSQEYSALAKHLCPNIEVEFIANDQQRAILQTHRVHCVQASGADNVKVADEICCRMHSTDLTPLTKTGFSNWRWCPTMYQHWTCKVRVPVTCIEYSDVQVNVRHRNAGRELKTKSTQETKLRTVCVSWHLVSCYSI